MSPGIEKVTHNLPINLDKGDNNKTLVKVFESLKRLADMPSVLQVVKELKDIDTHCLVAEPLNPEPWDLHRWIVLGNCDGKKTGKKTYISIAFSKTDFSPLPIVQINGDSLDGNNVALKARLVDYHKEWDCSKSVVSNLESILGRSISKDDPQTDSKEMNEECGICFCEIEIDPYDNNNNVGGVSCSNVKCPKTFHGCCLIEWLRDLPDSRMSLGYIFGACPVCGSSLSVRCSKQ